jgi:hypothetical protein
MKVNDYTGLNQGNKLDLPEGQLPAHIAALPDVKETKTYIVGDCPNAKAFTLWNNESKKIRIYHKEFPGEKPNYNKPRKIWIGKDGSEEWKTKLRLAVLEPGKKHLSIITASPGLTYDLEHDDLMATSTNSTPIRLTISNPKGKGYVIKTEADKGKIGAKTGFTPMGVKSLEAYGYNGDALLISMSDEEANGLDEAPAHVDEVSDDMPF